MDVNGLSKYKDLTEEKRIVCHDVKAFGIEWGLMIDIEQHESENFIAAYLFVNQDPINR